MVGGIWTSGNTQTCYKHTTFDFSVHIPIFRYPKHFSQSRLVLGTEGDLLCPPTPDTPFPPLSRNTDLHAERKRGEERREENQILIDEKVVWLSGNGCNGNMEQLGACHSTLSPANLFPFVNLKQGPD